MKRILIVSDIEGLHDLSASYWINNYVHLFKPYYKVEVHSACELASITQKPYVREKEEDTHNQFLNGGIDTAVKNLLAIPRSFYGAIGFSIGGTLLWKAALQNLELSALVCISSTRLRFESQQPICRTKLFFGEQDAHKPSLAWPLTNYCETVILPGQNHTFYNKSQAIETIGTELINFMHGG